MLMTKRWKTHETLSAPPAQVRLFPLPRQSPANEGKKQQKIERNLVRVFQATKHLKCMRRLCVRPERTLISFQGIHSLRVLCAGPCSAWRRHRHMSYDRTRSEGGSQRGHEEEGNTRRANEEEIQNEIEKIEIGTHIAPAKIY